MTRILDNRGMATRSNVSLAILTAVLIYGVWEIWHAATVSNDPTAYLFGIAFIGGSIYGLNTTLKETRDLVIALDADPATRAAVLTLWRPFHMKRIETSLDKLTGWRLWVEVTARGLKTFHLLAREPSYDGTLRFTLQRGMEIPEVLREVAREAIEDFERDTGVRRDDDPD
jgi:hypothetical protein